MTKTPLYLPDFEHDACGVGMVADLQQRTSHRTVSDALTILENLEHRGATGSDAQSGDGAGLMITLPEQWLRQQASRLGFSLPELGHFGVTVWFLPPGKVSGESRNFIDSIYEEKNLKVLGWRRTPTNNSELGPTALSSEPEQWMQFAESQHGLHGITLERVLFTARKKIEHLGFQGHSLYAASSSTATLVYKGMLTSSQLRRYFTDLNDSTMESSIALVHSRFSTNVFPSWPLAQPFRFIAHNGEINTIRSNRNWMTARESRLDTSIFGCDNIDIEPIVTPGKSDSASFDEVVELLTLGGRSLPHAILMMIPEAWERSTDMDRDRRDFYRYHSALIEPWDGPASVSFCDGKVVGAVLDRNGLRPARYWVTKDHRVIFSSEVGVLPIPADQVIRKGRLQPGRMFLVDTQQGRIVDDTEIKAELAAAQPYGHWLSQEQVSLEDLPPRVMLTPEHHNIRQQQILFGYTDEDLRLIVAPMSRSGEEPIGSMGSDTSLPALSKHNQNFYNYFTQHFAQVTNPPLDAIREELVTSMRVGVGPQLDLLHATPEHCHQIVLASPVLSLEEFAKLQYIQEDGGTSGFRSYVVDGLMDVTWGHDHPGDALSAALREVTTRAIDAVRSGANIIIISDRHASDLRAPIPSLLATAAVHHQLVVEKLRAHVALIVETGDAREVHHVATLLGFGASAVAPYVAYESIEDLCRSGVLTGMSPEIARYHYAKSLVKGVTKIMSKMGVSTVSSYIGSQLFEVVGLADHVVSTYFPGTPSRIGGLTMDAIANACLERHRRAFGSGFATDSALEVRGEYQWRRDGEVHLFNPTTVFKLQHATRTKQMSVFREYSELVNEQSSSLVTLRSLLQFKTAATPTKLADVESVTSLYPRFSTGAMSYGSISAEAHENLAIAMNRIGGKSNTGEGGEDAERFTTTNVRFNKRSAIKQVASGRFGVTSEYLVNADDIQIKIAQGAKPGEGGQLPGSKVYPWIAATRHSTPGVGLISPPPHHDIYSIEDLAQLIYDLKNANEQARIHVKLVSEAGVGTVAAGVAKAHADVILISGFDGGTGAAPLTSLKHAGTSWEVGLAETQQTLVANGLRNRVVVQVDGQLKTGRDVVIAALLGAEEFGFASAPLVVSGCVMMRVCQLDTCPVGIATQNPELRKRFSGQPEFVETFFEYIAEEVREILSSLGLTSLEDAIGRTDLLEVDHSRLPKDSAFELERLLGAPTAGQRFNTTQQDHGLSSVLDRSFIEDALAAVDRDEIFTYSSVIHNTDRTVGTLTGAAITRKLARRQLEHDSVILNFEGSAGQSLGAFIPQGMTIRLSGDANDYIGKGLSGGRIVIRVPEDASYTSSDNIIAGNVIAYGATAGEIFLHGIVGERLAVRNSGATIVTEGAGDHACEYMTGGKVVVLGPVGRNFAAGMSGGIAYLYDPNSLVSSVLSSGDFDIDVLELDDETFLRRLLHRFVSETESSTAAKILIEWNHERMNFVKIQSTEYRRVTEALERG